MMGPDGGGNPTGELAKKIADTYRIEIHQDYQKFGEEIGAIRKKNPFTGFQISTLALPNPKLLVEYL